MDQIIIHVDMDAFYASVEIRDDPALGRKPLIIGAMPSERGVVATCSYEARKYGVRSGMNIKEAYSLCPGGIYKHPDFEKYRAVSEQLHSIWNTYASASEYVALDEAYLDVTAQAGDLEGARRIAHLIKKRTRDELGLTCSVGVAYSKTAAKTASEEKKPDGYFEIPTKEDFVDLIIDRDVRVLYLVGAKTAEKLRSYGIHTVRDLRENKDDIARIFGKQGQWILQLAFGIDDRKVEPYLPQDAKSISRELTFQEDVDDFDFLKDILLLLALSVERKAKRVELYGGGVTLKITYSNMKSITRSRISPGCDSALTIYREALLLLDKVKRDPVRLLGVGIYNLSDEKDTQLSLFDIIDGADNVESAESTGNAELGALLSRLEKRYGIELSGNPDQVARAESLHATAEYMRKKYFSGAVQ